MAKDKDAEKSENAENAALLAALKREDAREEEAWKVETDKAAYGRKRIVVPDRWY